MPGVELPSDAPAPRQCSVKKSYPEQEYGFNLHAERGKGQFIGNVDKGSPADLAGLLPGDRIYGVNGQSIVDENHKQVVRRIKENPLECALLVIDEEGEAWYERKGIPIAPDLPNIVAGDRRASSAIDEQDEPPPSPRENGHDSTPPPADPPHDDHYPPPPPPPYEPEPEPQLQDEEVAVVSEMVGRLCVVAKGVESDEFGFNLHAERGRGHFVGKVDYDSIGERAGLELGQRIVGVNRTLIYPDTPHKDVVALIRADPLRAELLVANEEVDTWHRERGAEYDFVQAERYQPRDAAASSEHSPPSPSSSHDRSKSSRDESVEAVVVETQPPPPVEVPQDRHIDVVVKETTPPPSQPSSYREEPTRVAYKPPPEIKPLPKAVPPSKVIDVPSTGNEELDGVFRMSAAEMREQLKSRKKRDPKTQQNLTVLEKYKIVANL